MKNKKCQCGSTENPHTCFGFEPKVNNIEETVTTLVNYKVENEAEFADVALDVITKAKETNN